MHASDFRALARRVGVLGGLVSYREATRVATLKSLDQNEVLDALGRLSRLVDDRSDTVRLALAETMVRLTEAGHEALTKQWLMRQSSLRRRAWMNPVRHRQAGHPVEMA